MYIFSLFFLLVAVVVVIIIIFSPYRCCYGFLSPSKGRKEKNIIIKTPLCLLCGVVLFVWCCGGVCVVLRCCGVVCCGVVCCGVDSNKVQGGYTVC